MVDVNVKTEQLFNLILTETEAIILRAYLQNPKNTEIPEDVQKTIKEIFIALNNSLRPHNTDSGEF